MDRQSQSVCATSFEISSEKRQQLYRVAPDECCTILELGQDGLEQGVFIKSGKFECKLWLDWLTSEGVVSWLGGWRL